MPLELVAERFFKFFGFCRDAMFSRVAATPGGTLPCEEVGRDVPEVGGGSSNFWGFIFTPNSKGIS